MRNPQTGFTRTVKADAEGYYRFPFLPVGTYVVEATRNGTTLGKLDGSDCVARCRDHRQCDARDDYGRGDSGRRGTRIVNAVDVNSTESATNRDAR